MAPWDATKHSKRNRRASGNSNGNSNSNDGGGKDFEDDNNGNKASIDSPFGKGFSAPTVTLRVTSTVTATTVQTSLVLQTMVVESAKNVTSSSLTPSSTSASSTSSVVGVAMPLNTGTISPPSTTMPIPVASIISIILSGLFFITLCLVIYMRNPTLSSRILRTLKGNYRRQPPPTIGSFEPKEYKGFSMQDGFRESFRSYLALARQSSALSEISTTASSQSRARIVLSADASYGYSASTASSPSRGSASTISQYSLSQDKDANEEKRSSSRGVSDFEYPFESDEASSRLSVKRATTESEHAKFPQDVDEMTLDSVGVGGRSSL